MSEKNEPTEEDLARRYAKNPGREWRLLAGRETDTLEVRNEGTFDELGR